MKMSQVSLKFHTHEDYCLVPIEIIDRFKVKISAQIDKETKCRR